jgi:ubiquinone/menaquinone biosynthesis C-methylase UbiE
MESTPHQTYILDPYSSAELARLINQDRMLTQTMGGPLDGVANQGSLKNVLDLGCGPGGWVLDVAFALPDAEVEGVDISRAMVDYANTRAQTQVLTNASFGVMDITDPLDFPDASFDLVNARLLFAVLKRDAWPAFLSECTRILRPGGLLRLTEPAQFAATSSAAVNQLLELLITQALWKTGYGFSPDGRSFGIVHILPQLLRGLGYQHVQLSTHPIEFSFGTASWADQYHNVEVISSQVKPLFVKLGLVEADLFDQLQQRALSDMVREDFAAVGQMTTVLGIKPPVTRDPADDASDVS